MPLEGLFDLVKKLRDEKPFTQSRELNGLHFEVNYSLSALVNNTKLIIKHAGQDPAQFKVRFS